MQSNMLSMLSAFTGMEIAIIVVIASLCAALVIINVVVLLVCFTHRNYVLQQAAPVENSTPAPAPEPEPEPMSEPEPAPEPEPEPAVAEEAAAASEPVAVEEDDADNSLRYNRSFEARLIQSDDELKGRYSVIKNELMAYKKLSCRMSWKKESFSYRRNPVAKLLIKGKTLCLYLALNAADYADSKYKLEDVSEISQFADTPALYRLKNDRRVKYAAELIAVIMERLGVERREIPQVDYYQPYCGTLTLINRGLIKRVVEDEKTAFIKRSPEAAQGTASEDKTEE